MVAAVKAGEGRFQGRTPETRTQFAELSEYPCCGISATLNCTRNPESPQFNVSKCRSFSKSGHLILTPNSRALILGTPTTETVIFTEWAVILRSWNRGKTTLALKHQFQDVTAGSSEMNKKKPGAKHSDRAVRAPGSTSSLAVHSGM